MSRTFKRLEGRGLVTRIKRRKKVRMVRRMLTPVGRSAAEELSRS